MQRIPREERGQKARGGGIITAKRAQGTKLKRKIEIPREISAYQDGESEQRRNGKRLWEKAKFRVTEVPSQLLGIKEGRSQNPG